MSTPDPGQEAARDASLLPIKLRQALEGEPRLALAFSGGLDSRFLAFAAKLCGCHTVLFHAKGPLTPARESEFAKSWALKNGFEFHEFYHDPLQLVQVATNAPTRCYACKTAMLQGLKEMMTALQIYGTICDGSHRGDEKAYRPGRRALLEAGVLSPLAQAELGKKEISHYGRIIGLSHCNQKARPCLLTRLAYNLEADRQTLLAVDACEQEIEAMLRGKNMNDADFRLRLAPEPVFQFAADADSPLRTEITAILSRHGFAGADFRTAEEISGFFDRPQAPKD